MSKDILDHDGRTSGQTENGTERNSHMHKDHDAGGRHRIEKADKT